ncbi:MAG: DUF4169 family protein [Alphaproteobacteria bacterium]|nr:DUF4169 family protein [Alphaproteobacteria bacterium]
MSKIINLRRARKAKTRAEGAAKAEENRARFGRTKAERSRDDDEAARAARHLDAHKREDGID